MNLVHNALARGGAGRGDPEALGVADHAQLRATMARLECHMLQHMRCPLHNLVLAASRHVDADGRGWRGQVGGGDFEAVVKRSDLQWLVQHSDMQMCCRLLLPWWE